MKLPQLPDSGSPLTLLGGLAPDEFMRRYWQKRPLLIRSAIPDIRPPLSRAKLFALAARADVESRLVMRETGGRWTLQEGPVGKSNLPAIDEPRWTLLVQGVDLHDDQAHALLQSFRFVPDARLDDLMISWASDGGGVGPHLDSYDVFLLQARGRRRWRIGKPQDQRLKKRAPLRILRRFVAKQEYLLEPGDMLYLPPGWAHEGTAVGGDCMTCSIGFRAPQRSALAADLVARLADGWDDAALYADPEFAPTPHPAQMPAALQAFAADAVQRLITRPGELNAALGEALTEPKSGVRFDARAAPRLPGAVALDRRTRMLYDARHVFINGESYRAAGKDARLMRRLADRRFLDRHELRRASRAARSLLRDWLRAGWLRALDPDDRQG